MKIRDLIYCACFSSLICIGGFLKITIPPFPIAFSMQVFFVILSSLVLDTKSAIISVIVYIVLGLIGFPVFSLGGGMGYVFQPTFGYIIGFIPACLICGYVSKKTNMHVISSVLGIFVIYLIGTMYFWLIKGVYMGDGVSLCYIILNGALVFLPFDLLSVSVASYISKRIKKSLSGAI